MRLSKLIGKTLRQPPSDAQLTSHQLLVRAGYLREVKAGLFAPLPLGQRTRRRLWRLVRHELAALGGQELHLPNVPDAEPTAVLGRLVRREIDSYRQLPGLLYHAAEVEVAEPTSRLGLFGATGRPAIDIHLFDSAEMASTQEVEKALARLLVACDVASLEAQAGSEGRHRHFLHPSGDEEVVHCPACGYAAGRAWATTRWPEPPDEPQEARHEIETPGCDTIATLADFLGIPESRTLKMVFVSVEGQVTCLVIRGDRQVDEAKLARLLGTSWYYPSLEHELEAIGAVGGYASPIGLDQARLRVVADPSIRSGRNFVSGANQPDYHIKNVNIPRDFSPGEWADLALVTAGDPCPECGAELEIETAFALVESRPPAPSQPEAEYLDAQGRSQRLWLARWRLDLDRLMAAVVEGHHDDYGLLWPPACAPLDVHLVALDLPKAGVAEQAEALYEQLQANGFAVLYDDRDASAGVKFNDADLIGLPLRLTVSKRSVKEGLVEAKWRHSRDRLKLDEEGLAAELSRLRDKTVPAQ